jgi:chemosensory pili system protein ChpB (putative protein-glutamate methylesterase)
VTDPALKVALLAREGEARDLLRRALAELGAELVLEADPDAVDAGMLAEARAGAVLFSVEPATEAALERLDGVLADPALGVVFDEAETTARLSGWDRNRWARHLAAKLLGRDPLPPGTSAEAHPEAALHLEPGIAQAAVVADEAALAGFTAEADASALAVPSATRFETPEPPSPEVFDLGELDLSEAERAAFGEFEARQHDRPGGFASVPLADADAVAEFDVDAELDADLARLAAELDARDDTGALPTGPSPGSPAALSLESPAQPDPPPPRHFDLSALELAPLDAPLPAAAAATTSRVPVPPALDGSHLALAPIEGEEVAAAGRLVLVLSGMGGPDAVRQLLRALPTGFPAAVLLRQALDGGRHDRFVEQLAKVSRLPVALAAAQETPPPREVRVLPGALPAAGALRLGDGPEALIAAVAASDGAVVVLSGAEPALVAPLAAALAAGLRVIVQDPDSCFEPTAAEALRTAGAPAVGASELAARLDACFPT